MTAPVPYMAEPILVTPLMDVNDPEFQLKKGISTKVARRIARYLEDQKMAEVIWPETKDSIMPKMSTQITYSLDKLIPIDVHFYKRLRDYMKRCDAEEREAVEAARFRFVRIRKMIIQSMIPLEDGRTEWESMAYPERGYMEEMRDADSKFEADIIR